MSDFKTWKTKLIECLANFDDEIALKFIDGKDIPKSDIIKAIKYGTKSRKFVPVLVGSALKNKGVQTVLDYIVDVMPSPLEPNNFANTNKK